MSKKSCKYCGMIHDITYTCSHKPTRSKWSYDNSNEQRKQIKQFRSTQKWKDTREYVYRRDKMLCQICIRELYDTKIKYSYDNVSVHHITPLVKDWDRRLDVYNLVSLCSKHHAQADSDNIDSDVLFEIARGNEENTK